VAELQAEVNRLTAAKHALRRELAAPAPEVAPPWPQPDPMQVPLPKWADYEEQGKTWDEYSDARDNALLRRAEHTATVKVRQQMEQEQAQRVDSVVEHTFRSTVEKARKAHPDFDEASAGLDAVPLNSAQGQLLRNLARHHPEGGEFLYQLGKRGELAEALANAPMHAANAFAAVMMDRDTNHVAFMASLSPETVAEVSAMPPASALVALTKLAAQAPRASGSPRSAPPISRAAAPIRPVGGGRNTAPAVDPDDLDFGPDYIQAANAREARERAARYGG